MNDEMINIKQQANKCQSYAFEKRSLNHVGIHLFTYDVYFHCTGT